MEEHNGIITYYAKSRKDWRKWLEKNHAKEKSVWLIFYKKDSGIPSIDYSEAVDEALCFGWIDSKPNKRDEESYYRFFSKRNPKSAWSKVNKNKVAVLLQEGLMTQAGLEVIESAKKSGAWNDLDEIESLTVPKDFMSLLKKNKTALINWESFPPSSKKIILLWLQSAKKEETRNKRMEETIRLAEQNIKANHYRQ